MYMPLQVRPNRFVAYNYNSDYLQHSAKDKASITDGKTICENAGLPCEDSFGGLPSMAATWSRLVVV